MKITSDKVFEPVEVKKPTEDHWGECPKVEEFNATPQSMQIASNHAFEPSKRIKRSVFNEETQEWQGVPLIDTSGPIQDGDNHSM